MIPRLRCAARGLLVGLLMIVPVVSSCWAQDGSNDRVAQMELHRPRHRTAAEAARLLEELLSDDATLRITVDERRNELLVSGSEETRRAVRELLPTLDRPEEPAAAVPAEKPEIRMYRGPMESLESWAQQLRERPDGVKTTVDPRRGVLLVMATPTSHRSIAAWIEARSSIAEPSRITSNSGLQRREATPAVSSRVPPASSSPRRSAANREVSGRWITIPAHLPATARDELTRLFETRLTWSDGQESRCRLALRDGEYVEITFENERSWYVTGPATAVDQLARLIAALGDEPRTDPMRRSQVMVLQRESQPSFENLVPQGNRTDSGMRNRNSSGRPAMFPSQVRPAAFLQDAPAVVPGQAPMPAVQDPDDEPMAPRPLDQFQGVEIDTLPDLDAVILRGRDEELRQLEEIIRELERIGRETQAEVQVVDLRFVASTRMAELIEDVSDDLVGGRQGRVSVIPLETPNALLLIGWGDAVKTIVDLIARLDQPTDPAVEFEVFPLRHAAADDIESTLQEFFDNREGLGPQITTSIDERTNSVIVHASPRDLQEVRTLLARLDVAKGERVRQARVFSLRHSLADDVADTLQDAIDAVSQGDSGAVLELMQVEGERQEALRTGVLEDVQITVDARNNQLIITAPMESFDVIEALIRQLDSPGLVVKIKIFPIINGDASSVVETLRALIPSDTGATIGPRLSSDPGETSLSPLRFTVDVRSNSVIATGSEGDLRIVEAIIVRLDEGDAMQRRNAVYQLKNAPAVDVALSINEFLRNQRQVDLAAPGQANPFQRLEKEVVVVPEPVANKLILSATPRYFEEIENLIEKLDEQPPQVLIQVLIAEVTLGDADEFGIELGIQDSVLFDRSLLGDLVTTNSSTQISTPGGVTTTNSQTIQAASNVPGYDFNNTLPLGNSGSEKSLATASLIGTQGLSNFAVGRGNSELGFGGLVLSASSQNVSMLIRALQETRRLEVLSRPQVRTLDNQPAFIQVGQRVPRIAESTTNQNGQSNSVLLENVGLIMAVTPRIGPDGTVVMEIDAEKSALGPEIEGIPVAVSTDGTIIRAPRIDTTTAQATVSAADGETIILGGLITKSSQEIHRKVPILGDIPIIKNLFRFDSQINRRTELMIVLTPRVIRNPQDEQKLKQTELARMSWCAADVYDLHGDLQYVLPNDLIAPTDDPVDVIYPAVDPRGSSSRRRTSETDAILLPEDAPAEDVPWDSSGNVDPSSSLPGPMRPTRGEPIELIRPEDPRFRPVGYSQPEGFPGAGIAPIGQPMFDPRVGPASWNPENPMAPMPPSENGYPVVPIPSEFTQPYPQFER